MSILAQYLSGAAQYSDLGTDNASIGGCTKPCVNRCYVPPVSRLPVVGTEWTLCVNDGALRKSTSAKDNLRAIYDEATSVAIAGTVGASGGMSH